MPRYFLNLRYRDHLFVGEESDFIARVNAVQGHALETARALVAHARLGSIRSSIRNWFDCAFEVTDQAGLVVLVMPFSATTNENEATREPGAD